MLGVRLPGFEPGSSARKAEMIDRTTPQPHLFLPSKED